MRQVCAVIIGGKRFAPVSLDNAGHNQADAGPVHYQVVNVIEEIAVSLGEKHAHPQQGRIEQGEGLYQLILHADNVHIGARFKLNLGKQLGAVGLDQFSASGGTTS